MVRRVVITLVVSIAATQPWHACTRTESVSVRHMIIESDLIVRVTADEYVARPSDSAVRAYGIPDSIVSFRVQEVLKGEAPIDGIAHSGYLVESDDFNDHGPPYEFVRPGGRSGNCYAKGYRRGAQYLLFLRKESAGYTPYWEPLAPVNEQLHSDGDAWIQYVKARLREQGYKFRVHVPLELSELILTDDRIIEYLHTDQPDRQPILLTSFHVDTESLDVGYAVRLVPAISAEFQRALQVTRMRIKPDQASVELFYPLEGMRAHFQFRRADGRWRIHKRRIWEN